MSLSDSLLSLLPDSLAADSDPYSDIFVENLLRNYATCVYPLRKTASSRNGGRSMEFSAVQSQSSLDLEGLSIAVRRRTSVIGRRVFSMDPVKTHSTSIDTMVGD